MSERFLGFRDRMRRWLRVSCASRDRGGNVSRGRSSPVRAATCTLFVWLWWGGEIEDDDRCRLIGVYFALGPAAQPQERLGENQRSVRRPSGAPFSAFTTFTPLRAADSTRRGLRVARSVCFAEVWDGIGLETGAVNSTDSDGNSCIWASRSARTRARNRWRLVFAVSTWPASS